MAPRDVVVVGGGPAGACAALGLLTAGHRVRVFERQREIVSSPCGEAMPRIAMSLLEQVTGFDTAPFVRHQPPDGRLVFPDGSTVVLIRDMLVLDRTAWQRALIQAVRDRGGEVETGVTVRRIRPDCRELELAGGRRVRFELCVDASGPGSRSVRLPDRMACTQLTVPHAPPPSDSLWFLLDRRFSAHGGWLFPRGRGYHLGVVGNARALRRWCRHLGLDHHTGTLTAGPIPVNGSRFVVGNVLVVGDAGGVAAAVHGGGLFPIIASLGPLVTAATSGDLTVYQRAASALVAMPVQLEAVRALRSFSNAELDRVAGVLSGQDLATPCGMPSDVAAGLAGLGALGRRFVAFLRGFVGNPIESIG